jgi:RNA polymerase sigma-70 factor (ECF subfamily)
VTIAIPILSPAAEPLAMTALDLAHHREDLRKFVLRRVGNPDLADDIIQETLLRALSTPAGFAGRSRPGTWLSAIALNVLRDHYRRTVTRAEAGEDHLPELPSEEPDPVLTLMQGEMGACIARQLSSLPDRHREVLALHDMSGASHAEIAAALGIAEGHARVLLHRARAGLRQRLGQNCELDFTCQDTPCLPRERREP